MLNAVEELDNSQTALDKIPTLSNLIETKTIAANPIRGMRPKSDETKRIDLPQGRHEKYLGWLEEIEHFLEGNPLIEHNDELIDDLKKEIEQAFKHSQFEGRIRYVIGEQIKEVDSQQKVEDRLVTTKRKQFESVLDIIERYSDAVHRFYEALKVISGYNTKIETKIIESRGHKLYVSNTFLLTQEKFLETINQHLVKESHITKLLCAEAHRLSPPGTLRTEVLRDPVRIHTSTSNSSSWW